jgi:polyphosphate glucokinase
MLFLGLGTGLGSALIVDGIVEPMELGHLPYKKFTFEDYVGLRGLQKYGKQNWRCHVTDMVRRLTAAIEPDEVVLGGGNVNKLVELPPGCRVGNNTNAFIGGFRLWEKSFRKITFTKSVAWSGVLGCVRPHTGRLFTPNKASGRIAHSFRTA